MPSNSTDESTDSSVTSDISTLSASELRVVLVCDVVESVRWMEHDEDNAITRWSQFAAHVRQHIAPAQGGSVVKSTGDGLVMEFANARDAVQAASAMHQHASAGNDGMPPEQQMHLRTGIHEAAIRRDAHDIYGHGVNLAARITTLAGPGEVIISAPVRDHLTDGLDGDIEDMGDCYLKHVSEPQRVYRVGAMGAKPVLTIRGDSAAVLQPAIAIIPFDNRSFNIEHGSVGDLIADSLISRLSRSNAMRLISRLSSAAFKNRNSSLEEIHDALRANYVVSGSYYINSQNIVLTVELSDCKSGGIVFSERLNDSFTDLFSRDSQLIEQMVARVNNAVVESEIHRAKSQPLPTLSSYSMYLGAITMMHRMSKNEFFRAYDLLLHLRERHSGHSAPPSWLAKWCVLQVEQGWAADKTLVSNLALDYSKRALDINPDSSMALAIDGFVKCNLHKDFDGALNSYQMALQINPSESVAWLFMAMLHAFKGEAAPAVQAITNALDLSPLDPTRYFYQSLAASVHLSAGNYEKSIAFSKQSLKANATHVSTHRALTIAQVMAGQINSAQLSAQKLLKLDPGLTVSKYLARSPGVQF